MAAVRSRHSSTGSQGTLSRVVKARKRDTRSCVECGTRALAADIRLCVPAGATTAEVAEKSIYHAWVCAKCRLVLSVRLLVPIRVTEVPLTATERAARAPLPRKASPKRIAEFRVVNGELVEVKTGDITPEWIVPASITPERAAHISDWEEGVVSENPPLRQGADGRWRNGNGKFVKAPRQRKLPVGEQFVGKRNRLVTRVPFEKRSNGVTGNTGSPVRNIVRVRYNPKRRRPDLYTNF